MATTTQDVSVIICAYTEDRWNDLIAAIKSVQQQTLQPTEIIVVIDHNPALLKRVQEHIPGIVLIENTQAQGLSGARNSGCAVAQSQIIAFLDDDALASPNWLTSLSQSFNDPRVLGSGGPVTPLWLGDAPAWLPEEFYWVIGCTYRGMPNTMTAIRNPIGANMCFRRDVFDAVGGFRDGIGRVGRQPIGCEETELCIRVRQGWPDSLFLYQPEAKVVHRVASERTSWHYFCVRCFAEGLSKAAVSHYVGFKDSLATEYSYIVCIVPKAVVQGLLNGLFRLDKAGFLRAGSIALGLMLTLTGYLVGNCFQPLIPHKGKSVR